MFSRLWLVVPFFLFAEANIKHSAAFLPSVICSQKKMKGWISATFSVWFNKQLYVRHTTFLCTMTFTLIPVWKCLNHCPFFCGFVLNYKEKKLWAKIFYFSCMCPGVSSCRLVQTKTFFCTLAEVCGHSLPSLSRVSEVRLSTLTQS